MPGRFKAAGAPPPAEWTALRQRLDDYISCTAQHPMLDKLTTAIIDGTDDDIPALKALAAAEMLDPQVSGRAVGHIQSLVLARLRAIYDGAAAANYKIIAGTYDKAAQRFADLADSVDAEADAAAMIDKPDKIRRAYLEAESFANQLTKLLPPLTAAATLTGTDVNLANNLLMLPLCVDITGQHRRKLWQAWDHSGGRCSRWGALHRLGAKIRACPLGEPLEPYRLPAERELRLRQIGGGRAEEYWFDPEDEQPPEIDPVIRRTSGRAVIA